MGLLHRAARATRSATAAALLGLAIAGRALALDILVDDFCSLADAIRAANDGVPHGGCPGGDPFQQDVIHLSKDVTLGGAQVDSTLIGGAQAGTPDVTSSIVIEGNGHRIRRDQLLSCEPADEGADFRLLQVLGGSLTLNDAKLTNGCVIDPVVAEGGAVLVGGGTLALNDVGFGGNVARGSDGSADGSITPGTAEGGAVFVDGASTAAIVNAAFGTYSLGEFLSGNTARGGDDLHGLTDAGGAFGGAVFVASTGVVTVSGTSFRYNLAQGGHASGTHLGGVAGGGAIEGPLTSLQSSSFVINQADGGAAAAGAGGAASGGGFDSAILGDVQSLYVLANFALGGSSDSGAGGTASGGGAAMAPGPSGTRLLTDAWFAGNYANGGSGSVGGLAVGGGATVSLANATLAIRDSTWSNNQANGGDGGGLCVGCLFASPATVTLANVTIFHNGATGLGGGIFSSGSLTLGSTTVAGNQAFGSSGGGGVYASGALTLGSSILADNFAISSDSDCALLGGGAYTSAGYNWIETASASCPGNGVNDHGGDPGLGTFDFHNAPLIPTVALSATSPAIDQGSCSAGASVTTDERGFARPQDLPPADALLGCDPGAFELFDHDFEIAVVDSADPVLAGAPVSTFTDTVTLTNIGYSATVGIDVSVTFSLGVGVTLGGHSASTGSVTCDLTSCTWTGATLAADGSATLDISLNVATDAPDSFVSCTATVTAPTTTEGGLPASFQFTNVRARKIFANGFETDDSAWSAVQ